MFYKQHIISIFFKSKGLFKYLLNNYNTFVYLNTNRIKINLWAFVHVQILYLYQRTSIMVWFNTIEGLTSKFIKTIRTTFNFFNLYRNTLTYSIIFITLLLVI